jgi:ubiquinone/menaquinone biosynthesis C-methylase UbiE/uncharacterized protein YbaR (Trm112 family)
MRESLLNFLQCPKCEEYPLRLSDGERRQADIWRGTLRCPRCESSFPIIEGVPSFVTPAEVPNGVSVSQNEASLQESERRFRDVQSADYEEGYPAAVTAVEVPCVIQALHAGEADVVLDVGCGTGRVSKPVRGSCNTIIGIDFALQMLQRYQHDIRGAESATETHLVHADARHLPLRTSIVDRAVSDGLIQHIPSAQSRSESVSEIARVLKDIGTFVFVGFNHSLVKRVRGPFLKDKALDIYEKEGVHRGLLYYYNFSVDDAKRLLSPHFQVKALRGLITPLVRRFPCAATIRVERWITRTFVGRALGHLLQVEAVKMPPARREVGHAIK